MILRIFGWSFGITLIALVGAFVLGGPQAGLIVLILIVLEISLSFDNAVVNATILVRMSPFWQKIFLTVGIAIAVFGMRLLFPLLLVGITASLNPIDVVRLALEGGNPEEPGTYGYLLDQAHPAIAAFGGMFLLMLFMNWLLSEKDHYWLGWFERPLAKAGQLPEIGTVLAIILLVVAAETWAADYAETVLISGLLGAITYIAVNGLGELFAGQGVLAETEVDSEASGPEGPSGLAVATGKAAFFLFLYLEVLDASFSFDGVVGAFAITQDIFIIATGLGVGALYIRSLTVFLVRKGTLNEYVYLEHGAHWAIGALALLLLLTIAFEIPELVTGLIGVGFIGVALFSSIQRNRRVASEGHPEAMHVEVGTRV